MRRVLLLFIFSASIVYCKGQEKQNVESVIIQKNKIPDFIDSLRQSLLKDTSNFKASEVIISGLGLKNINPYAPLIVINNNYRYKLDIISGQKVQEFINTFFEVKKIKNIVVLNNVLGATVYGESGKSGVIMIKLKRLKKNNLLVSNFAFKGLKKNYGDNFDQ